jgi:hypothetical protein
MDNSVIRAMARWPEVPAVYGWLSLDRRGRWCLQGDPVTHRGAIAFINRNYAGTDQGQWYFQNGPQRVFVDLDYAPWVYALDGHGNLADHTGRSVNELTGVRVDEDGNLLLVTERGIGLLSDRDLEPVSDRLRRADGGPCDEESIAHLIRSGKDAEAERIYLDWNGEQIQVSAVLREQVSKIFGFEARPRAGRTRA